MDTITRFKQPTARFKPKQIKINKNRNFQIFIYLNLLTIKKKKKKLFAYKQTYIEHIIISICKEIE